MKTQKLLQDIYGLNPRVYTELMSDSSSSSDEELLRYTYLILNRKPVTPDKLVKFDVVESKPVIDTIRLLFRKYYNSYTSDSSLVAFSLDGNDVSTSSCYGRIFQSICLTGVNKNQRITISMQKLIVDCIGVLIHPFPSFWKLKMVDGDYYRNEVIKEIQSILTEEGESKPKPATKGKSKNVSK